MPLFEVAILEVPSKKEAEEGATEKLVLAPTFVVAKDAHAAGFKVALDSADKLKDVNKERMTVVTRPFA